MLVLGPDDTATTSRLLFPSATATASTATASNTITTTTTIPTPFHYSPTTTTMTMPMISATPMKNSSMIRRKKTSPITKDTTTSRGRSESDDQEDAIGTTRESHWKSIPAAIDNTVADSVVFDSVAAGDVVAGEIAVAVAIADGVAADIAGR